MPSFRGSSQLRDQTCIFYVSCISKWVLYANGFFITSVTWEAPGIHTYQPSSPQQLLLVFLDPHSGQVCQASPCPNPLARWPWSS